MLMITNVIADNISFAKQQHVHGDIKEAVKEASSQARKQKNFFKHKCDSELEIAVYLLCGTKVVYISIDKDDDTAVYVARGYMDREGGRHTHGYFKEN